MKELHKCDTKANQQRDQAIRFELIRIGKMSFDEALKIEKQECESSIKQAKKELYD